MHFNNDDLLDDAKRLEADIDWLPWAIAGVILVFVLAAVVLVPTILRPETPTLRTMHFRGDGVHMIALHTPVYYDGDLVGQITDVDMLAERACAHLSALSDSNVVASIECESRWLPGPLCIRLWPADDPMSGNDVVELQATTWLIAHTPLPGFAVLSSATLLSIVALVVAARTLQRFILLLNVLRAFIALAIVCVWGWPILRQVIE